MYKLFQIKEVWVEKCVFCCCYWNIASLAATWPTEGMPSLEGDAVGGTVLGGWGVTSVFGGCGVVDAHWCTPYKQNITWAG